MLTSEGVSALGGGAHPDTKTGIDAEQLLRLSAEAKSWNDRARRKVKE